MSFRNVFAMLGMLMGFVVALPSLFYGLICSVYALRMAWEYENMSDILGTVGADLLLAFIGSAVGIGLIAAGWGMRAK